MSSTQATRLLSHWRDGNKTALDELTPLVYGELRRLASRYLSKERTDHTLQPTALIHEAYLRLVDRKLPGFNDRTHFIAVASQLMRQILVDHARSHRAEKRGGGFGKVPLEEAVSYSRHKAAEFVALDDALRELAGFDPRKCRIIELRFFGGLTLEEIADTMGISIATAGREIRLAQAWVYRAMSENERA